MIRKVPLSANKQAAQQMMGELLAGAERERANGKDPFAAHRKVPLADHLAAYRRSFAEKGHTERQAALSFARASAVLDGCRFMYLADLDAGAAQTWLSDRRATTKGFGAKTLNHYVAVLRAFGNWLVRSKRLPANPFAHLAKVNAEVDVRHRRREFAAEEFARLVAAARASGVRRHFPGPDRAMLYLTAAYTGLRASELASLTPEAFALAADPPTVTVAAACSKRRREDLVPLHPELATLLRPYLAGKPAGVRFWFGKTARGFTGSLMIEADLAAARDTWVAEAADPAERTRREASDFLRYVDSRGQMADFHSLRHTFITNLVAAGVMPKEAKELARHSSITLTMDRYAHTTRGNMAAALAKLAGPSGTSGGTSGPVVPSELLPEKRMQNPPTGPCTRRRPGSFGR